MAISNSDGSIILSTKVDTSGINKGMSQMQGKATSLTKTFSKLGAVIASAFAIQKIIQFSNEAGQLATQTEASVQRLVDIYGSASDSVGDFIDANARALGMSKAAAASFSSVYGNLFSVWADQATNAELTNRYLNMTAVVASKTGRTVEDVQERIRSGLLGNTEAIEDLGVFVNVKTIEMTDAFQRMASGKSWEQLDAYTQQQIRSMAILEQATAKYGDEVADTSATIRNRFNAAYQDFKNSWGSLVNTVLLPILQMLTQIFDIATKGINAYLGKDGQILDNAEAENNLSHNTAENIENQTQNQKELNKELKKSLAAFDDIQILSSQALENTTPPKNEENEYWTPPKIDAENGAELPPILQGLLNSALKVKDVVANALEGLGNAMRPILNHISQMNAEQWERLFNVVFAGLLAIGTVRIATSAIDGILNLAIALSRLNPLLVGAEALFALFIYGKISAGETPADALAGKLENLATRIHNASKEIDNFINTSTARLDGVSEKFDVIDEIADKYYNLSQKANLNDEDLTLLKYYYDYLVENGVDLVGKIDAVTFAFKGTREELEKSVDAVLKMLATEAASDEIIAAYKEKFKQEKQLAEFEREAKTLYDQVLQAREELEKAENASYGGGTLGVYNKKTAIRQKESELREIEEAYSKVVGSMVVAQSKIKEIDDLIADYANIIATEGSSYTKQVTDGLNEINETKVDPDFSPLMQSIGAVQGRLSDVVNTWNAIMDGFKTPFEKIVPKNIYGGTGVSIPRLAQGAVIPPNREFLAVLGDQKQGTNIEAPLQTIVDAFNIALAQNGNVGGGNTEVVLELDGRELGRAVVEQGNKENRRIGTRLVIV